MGHIGYTPQFKKNFKIEGRTNLETQDLIKDALLIQRKQEHFSIVLECISPIAAKLITIKLEYRLLGLAPLYIVMAKY